MPKITLRRMFCSALAGTFLCLGTMTIPAKAITSPLLTPGLEHLAVSCGMIRSGLISTEIGFSREDFANALGYVPTAVTITSLPPAAEGTLYFGTLPAAVNQEITGANLSLLRFVPNGSCTGSSFRFQGDHGYSHLCTVRFTQTVNQSPLTDMDDTAAVWTQQDISTYGKLPGSDPDGDALYYEITAQPFKGLLSLTNPATGEYRYTPFEGTGGSDVFSYQIRDSYGNYSAIRTVEVTIDAPACTLVFADMTDHWAQNAAVVMAAEDTMEVFARGGEVYFYPDENMTRESYLVTVMKALGAGDIAPCDTVFADQDHMAPDSTGYIHRAYSLGIIRGSAENGSLFFRPDDNITRAEAAVILNAILGAESPDVVPVFADTTTIPTWASPSLYALNNLGILQGTGDGFLNPSGLLTRAQTAQMLLTVKNLYGDV